MEKENTKLTSGLREFSVVYTDRALNFMSPPFQQVMKDISSRLKLVYKGEHVAIIPGSGMLRSSTPFLRVSLLGSYAMEAVARQFATGTNSCLFVRVVLSCRQGSDGDSQWLLLVSLVRHL
jgi:aspartate aminotransferase-like enzyme